MSPQSYYTIGLPKTTYRAQPSILGVLPSSPKSRRDHVERFARYFLRERGKGFLQFEAKETSDSESVPYQAYLFLAQDRHIGACCFRDRGSNDSSSRWWLDWVWLHPYFRSRHHLTNAWPHFEEQYGRFHLAQPLSQSMQAFVLKVGWHETPKPSTEQTAAGMPVAAVHLNQ